MIAWPGLFSRGGELAAMCLTAGAVTLLAVGDAHANPRAEELSAQAGDLLFASPPDYDGAIEKYQQAIVLAPEGKYYFNLCAAYYESGRYGLALQACDAVAQVGADDKVLGKTAKVLEMVEKQLRGMGLDPAVLRQQIKQAEEGDGGGGGGDGGGGDGGGGDGGGGDGGGGDGGDGGGGGDGSGGGPGSGQVDLDKYSAEKPQQSLFATKPLTHDYTWTVGGALMPSSASVGDGMFGSGAFGIRGWVDYMVVPARKIGLQGHVGFTNVAAADEFSDSLSIVEMGGSVYAHVKCMGRTCITPLAGVTLAGLQPSSLGEEVRMATIGLRAEGSVSVAFGPRWQHVLSFTPGFNVYLPAFGSYDDGTSPADYGLDKASSTFYFGLGYTRRFDTPFGQAPFITLE